MKRFPHPPEIPLGKAATLVGLCLVFLFAGTHPNRADGRVDLSGYLRQLGGIQDFGYDPGFLAPESNRLLTGIGRLQTRVHFSESSFLEVHNRLFWEVTSEQRLQGGFSPFGLGASRQPDRWMDLDSTLEEGSRSRLVHDLDRLAVHGTVGGADVTIGRQAVTWGKAVLFPVADLWAQFSPFELDTTEKPGVDAVRILTYPSPLSELDIVGAMRESPEDWSAAVRYGFTTGALDGYLAAGKFWEQFMLMGGGAWLLQNGKIRLEVVWPYDLDDPATLPPRITAGWDYLGSDWTVSLEYHLNGAGAPDADQYLQQLQSDVFLRGESYYLGRHYAGLTGGYSGFSFYELTGGVIANLQDPSYVVTGAVDYEWSQNLIVSAGGNHSLGDEPNISGIAVQLESEYGTFGNFYYLEVARFF